MGECKHNLVDFVCSCNEGYSGKVYDTWMCEFILLDFVCTCKDGYSGKVCDICKCKDIM